MGTIPEENLFILTLVGNIRNRAGNVKLSAKNSAGEVTVEANLSVAGSPPEFTEPPYISQVLEGQFVCRKNTLSLAFGRSNLLTLTACFT